GVSTGYRPAGTRRIQPSAPRIASGAVRRPLRDQPRARPRRDHRSALRLLRWLVRHGLNEAARDRYLGSEHDSLLDDPRLVRAQPWAADRRHWTVRLDDLCSG